MKTAKAAAATQKVLSVAMRETEQIGLLPSTKLSNVFDSLDYLDFILVLQKEIGPISNELAANADTFADLGGAYASTS